MSEGKSKGFNKKITSNVAKRKFDEKVFGKHVRKQLTCFL